MYARNVSLLVPQKIHFLGLKIYVAPRLAFLLKNFRKLFHDKEIVGNICVFCRSLYVAVKQCLHRSVGKAVSAADDGGVNVAAHHLALRVDRHFAGESKPVHSLEQRTNAVGKAGGKHGEHHFGKIYACAPRKRLVVYLAAALYVVGNVRNMHAQDEVALAVCIYGTASSQILGVFAVDGKHLFASQIPAPLAFVGINGVGHFFRLGLAGGGEFLSRP